MNREINENIICLLVHNSEFNRVEILYKHIVNPMSEYLENIVNFCDNYAIPINTIIDFLEKNSMPDDVKNYYSYCEYLGRPYQGVFISENRLIEEITEEKNNIEKDYKKNKDEDGKNIRIKNIKNKIKEKYTIWIKAHSIELAYEKYEDVKGKIAFSHRRCGWSTPVYKLTDSFSLEIKTNFGYGRSSYFYTKLKYKNIDITPFSDWTSYEFSKFWEITRYTRFYTLDNSQWEDALVFSKDACNLSITDEAKFVEKYIIEECEEMVSELESFLTKEKFIFLDIQKKRLGDPVYKSGHKLIEFRGEKISGSLEFISKILAFSHIANVKLFVSRIEKCNITIQPILLRELIMISEELEDLEKELILFKPEYESALAKWNDYAVKKNELKLEMTEEKKKKYIAVNVTFSDSDIVISANKLDIEFRKIFPEFTIYEEDFNKKKSKFISLNQKISNLKNTSKNIKKYEEDIAKYFHGR